MTANAPAHDAAAIAERLTKAQAARLENVAILNARCVSWTSANGSIGFHTCRATTRALAEKGLLFDMKGEARLTPLGLAVRASLAQSKGEE